jgi:hypothetical protein
MKYKITRKNINRKLILIISLIYFTLLVPAIIYKIWVLIFLSNITYIFLLLFLLGRTKFCGVIDISPENITVATDTESLCFKYSDIESIILYYDGYDGETHYSSVYMNLNYGKSNYIIINTEDTSRKYFFYSKNKFDEENIKEFVAYLKKNGIKVEYTSLL